MSNTSESENNSSVCANCGKGEEASIDLKACTACKLVKYCNRDCQIAHRPQHKKDCKKRAKELHDEKLFKQPPPKEDCPICFIRLPTLDTGKRYNACCGKVMCSGCVHAPVYDDQGNEVDSEKCPFCRVPRISESDEENIKRIKKRVEAGDAMAMHTLGVYYDKGIHGFPQDYTKALEFYHMAAELDNADAYHNIGCAYDNGEGVEVDAKKALYYYEQAAIRGNGVARNNLGNSEVLAGNMDRMVKHRIIAAGAGDDKSLEQIKLMYSNGDATKDDYMKALLSYQIYLSEIKSVQRDKAAADDEDNRYY